VFAGIALIEIYEEDQINPFQSQKKRAPAYFSMGRILWGFSWHIL